MKCRHQEVTSDEWYECPICGKIIRFNRKRSFVKHCAWWLYIMFGASRIANLSIEAFRLTNCNPHNIIHAIIGGISIVVMHFILDLLLPDYDEK